MRLILLLVGCAALTLGQSKIDLVKQGKNFPVIPACVGTPGNTPGAYHTACADASNVVYICTLNPTCSVAGDWAIWTGSGGGGGSALINVKKYTADATVGSSDLQRSVLTNIGAAGQVALTLGTAQCTAGQALTAYVAASQPIKLIPFTGDQIMNQTSAINHSVTSDSVATSFISLICLNAGQWYVAGLNGNWIDSN